MGLMHDYDHDGKMSQLRDRVLNVEYCENGGSRMYWAGGGS